MKNIFKTFSICILAFLVLSCAQPSTGGSKPLEPKYTVQSSANYSVESTTVDSSINKIVFNYNSCDINGNQIQLSGLIMYPETVAGKKLKQIVLVEHGTIQQNAQAPSVTKGADMSLAPSSDAENFTVIVTPDYLGFGKSKDKVHPYLNSEITAVNSLDMLLAAIKYFNDNNIQFSDSFNTMVTGYSQGGASALAVHKYIDTYLSQENCAKIKFSKSVCGGSPSDINATMEGYLATGFVLTESHIILVTQTIQSMLESYPEFSSKYSINDFFNSANFKNGKTAKDMLESLNKKDLAGLYAAIQTFPDNKSAEKVFSEDILNKNSQIRKDLVACFNKNKVTGWNLKHSLYAYHATDDNVVPYSNHQSLISGMSQYSTLFLEEHGESGNPSNTHGGYCESVFVGKLTAMRD